MFALVAVVGATLATKSDAMSTVTFYTTDVLNATDGAALPNAITTQAGIGHNVFYTTKQGAPANVHAFVTTSLN